MSVARLKPKTIESRDACEAKPLNYAPISRKKTVIGPHGNMLVMADLPPPGAKRWVTRQKAEVVAAVEGQLLSLNNACERYNMSLEEFWSWKRALKNYGLPGLRASYTQRYRNAAGPQEQSADSAG